MNEQRAASWLIVGGGVVFPTAVLFVLLAFGLRAVPRLIEAPSPGHLRIEVRGEQWWWRVRYLTPDGPVDLANELRLPVGERIDVVLTSADVIHSFWIPSISGKVDMIPGRTTHLSLEPTRTGTFRGACAEYCGASHALMAFQVVVVERDAFDAWLSGQSAAATPPSTPDLQRGQELFMSNGCGSCHAIRGTEADGEIGPDLTHMGSRLSLAAATHANDRAHMAAWIAAPEHSKPGALMPPFEALGEAQLRTLSAYLLELR